MAEGTLTRPACVERLLEALNDALPGAEIGVELVRRDRYRFMVVYQGFEDMGHPERQQIVWDLADRIVVGPDLWKISMIITMAPSEVQPA